MLMLVLLQLKPECTDALERVFKVQCNLVSRLTCHEYHRLELSWRLLSLDLSELSWRLLSLDLSSLAGEPGDFKSRPELS